jgi:hypothetical protein
MHQLILDISSEKDADLIKELLKRFKGVKVNIFETELSASQINKRIKKGIKNADEGKTKPWKEVKSDLLKRIKN